MKKKYYFIKMLLTGAVMYGAVTNINTVHAENGFMRPADYMLQDENGMYCMVDGIKLTGQFSLQPNYLLGDTELNGIVDAEDATSILTASAQEGAGILSAEKFIAQESKIDDEKQAFLLADVNQDSVIDAVDATEILKYSAQAGAGNSVNPLGFQLYYANADGYLQTGFIQDTETNQAYYANEDYTLVTGWFVLNNQQYYSDNNGIVQTGWQLIDGQRYYFSPENYTMQTGVLNLMEGKYYFDDNGVLIDREYFIDTTVREMLDNAELNPGKRQITVYDRQYYEEKGEPVEFTINLSDRDYEIIEKFASEHFTPDMTISECLYETWWWIHCNVDYAYAGEKWNEICNLSYPDAVFNHKLGQCVQYNGAMAAVLAYYGFDVYMVKGWTNPPKNTTQHYWTEVMINDTRYYVETGNQGKNGDYWQYFFVDADTVNYTQKNDTTENTES
ncbi:MAG: arylamine N-acetyltransferase [Oscillospiraceae bacterium]|nr:arylamine N-acetyltransferase [Oscillospiraceae bacterium]